LSETIPEKPALSTVVIASVAIVIIIVATGSYALLSPSRSTSSISTQFNSTVPSNMILNGTTSAGFFNSQLVSFGYTAVFKCTPALESFASNQTEATRASQVTSCEVGGGNSSAVSGAAPVFILVPAYAGLSIFGVRALGATSQGYPTFNNQLVFTQCGAGGTTSACSDHPTYLYSPFFTAVEKSIGIKSGYGGLPEGVLPTPSHDHVLDYEGGPSIPWDVITVLVFDPNVMPDGSSGQCHQWVPSNLTAPTHNCLTSFTALASALSTKTTADANANHTQSDPIFTALGGPDTQVLIPGVTMVTDNSPANTNIFLYFAVQASDPYQ
jgi:hypothetical protein